MHQRRSALHVAVWCRLKRALKPHGQIYAALQRFAAKLAIGLPEVPGKAPPKKAAPKTAAHQKAAPKSKDKKAASKSKKRYSHLLVTYTKPPYIQEEFCSLNTQLQPLNPQGM